MYTTCTFLFLSFGGLSVFAIFCDHNPPVEDGWVEARGGGSYLFNNNKETPNVGKVSEQEDRQLHEIKVYFTNP